MPADDSTEAKRDNSGFVAVLRDHIACALVAVDADQRITTFNAEAESLMGLKADQVLNHSFQVLPSSVQEVIQETFLIRKAVSDRQIILCDNRGGELTLCANTVLSPAGGNTTFGVIAVFNDFGSAKKLGADLRQLDRMASIVTFSASMAHEIKNALVAVKTFVDLLLQRNKDAELAELVRRELQRIDSIVSQMLRFAGPSQPTFASIRLHEVLDRALRLIQPQLEDKRIALNQSFAAMSDTVRGDDYQLEQAFINLFFNALEAMSPNGNLSVTTEIILSKNESPSTSPDRGDQRLRVTVKDTGVGIAPKNIERLFEPFFTTKPNGTGLGLSITRRIIHEHHGAITVESELDKGTTFSIVLPILLKTN